MSNQPMIVHLCNDLMMSSAVRAQAAVSGLTADFISSVQALETKLSTDQLRFIIVDLQLPNLDLNQLLTVLVRRPSAAKVIMYAQHVNDELLHAAKEIGVGQVVTRGQFAKSLTHLFAMK